MSPRIRFMKKQHPNFLFSKSTVLTFQSAAKNDALIELSWICLYEITRQLGFDFRGPSPEPVVWRPASLRQWNGGEMVQELGRSEGNGGFRSPKLSEAQAVGRRSPVVQGAPVVQRCFSTQVEWSNGGSLFVKLEDLRKVLVTTFFWGHLQSCYHQPGCPRDAPQATWAGHAIFSGCSR